MTDPADNITSFHLEWHFYTFYSVYHTRYKRAALTIFEILILIFLGSDPRHVILHDAINIGVLSRSLGT